MVSAVGSVPAYATYLRLLRTDPAAEKAKIAQNPIVQKKIDYYRVKTAELKTPAEFLADRNLLSFTLTAYSMASEMDYPGRIKAVLLSDPSDPGALANRMGAPSYKSIAKLFSLNQDGVEKIKNEDFVDTTIDQFITNEYDARLADINPALRDVNYFKRVIGNVKHIYEVMGDGVLRGMVMEAGNLPRQIVNYPLAKQAEMFSSKFDIEQVKDSAYIEKFVQRFLAQRDAQDIQSRTNPLLGLLG